MRKMFGSHNLMEKELPQEQPWSAWGFLRTRKVERISSWLKSTVAPFKNSRLSWSTMTPTPPCSNTLATDCVQGGTRLIVLITPEWDQLKTVTQKVKLVTCPYRSSSFLLRSIENLYWKPEQPPPSTCILRYSPFSMISSSLWMKDENDEAKAFINAVVASQEHLSHNGFLWIQGECKHNLNLQISPNKTYCQSSIQDTHTFPTYICWEFKTKNNLYQYILTLALTSPLPDVYSCIWLSLSP